jgi:hypothetical protein
MKTKVKKEKITETALVSTSELLEHVLINKGILWNIYN